MSVFRRVRVLMLFMALLAACSPMGPSSPDSPQSLPTPARDWKVSLRQSGGFVGVMLKVDVSSDGQLTAVDERSGKTVTRAVTAADLARLVTLYNAMAASTPNGPRPSACADCFIYDLTIEAGGTPLEIHADDTNLADSGAAELIAALQALRDTALRSQP